MTYTYRSATARDGEACARIVCAWSEETPWIEPVRDFDGVVAFWSGFLHNVPTSWVCVSDGDVVGFCAREDDNIGGLYLAKTARGQGVGKHLLNLAKEDRDWITVWAYALNDRARKFYRREGCLEISREIDERYGLEDVEHRWTRKK